MNLCFIDLNQVTMIKTKKELSFYIQADRMMNRGCFKPSLSDRIKNLISPDYTMRFLKAMRYVSFYSSLNGGGKLLYYKWLMRYKQLSLKLGYAISPNVFGYGLVIPA